MLHGHFGAALLISSLSPTARPPLALLFVASQLQDILIALLLYVLGIEQAHIEPEPRVNRVFPIVLDSIEYSHSLFTTVICAVVCTVIFGRLVGRGWSEGMMVGGAVVSHWILDACVHLPDLEVCFPFADCGKVGLGLWRYRWVSTALECGVIVVGFAMYMRGKGGRARVWGRLGGMVAVLVLTTLGLPFAPVPERLGVEVAVQMFATYLVFGLWAWWVERGLKEVGVERKKE